MSVYVRLSLLSALSLILTLAFTSPRCFAESGRTIYIKPKATKVNLVQPKVTGNYEQLIELQRDAVKQAVIKTKAAKEEAQKIRNAINKYEAEAELKKQQEKAAEPVPAPVTSEHAGSLRSLEGADEEQNMEDEESEQSASEPAS